mgnify:CR=1 FL=1
MELLKNPSGHISDPAILKDAPGGTVFLFRALTDAQSEDWRASGLGHHFRQTGGKPTITSVTGYIRKVFHIVLPGQIRDKRFQRITWSLEGNPRDTLIQYWGDASLSVPLVHGNSKKNNRPYSHLYPSVVREIEASPLKASEVTAKLVERAREVSVATGRPVSSVQGVMTPNCNTQVRQLQKKWRDQKQTMDSFEQMFTISQQYDSVRLFIVCPRLVLLFATDESIKYMRDILKVSWEEGGRRQEVSYDTQFELGDFYVSTLTVKDIRLENRETGKNPIVAGFTVLHDRKFQADHETAFRRITELVPELKTQKFVATCDGEFRGLLKSTFKKAFVANCEIHIWKDIARWVGKHGGTKAQVEFYKDQYRDLVRCKTRSEYDQLYDALSPLWTLSGFKKYFDNYIGKNIDGSGRWSALSLGWKVGILR